MTSVDVSAPKVVVSTWLFNNRTDAVQVYDKFQFINVSLEQKYTGERKQSLALLTCLPVRRQNITYLMVMLLISVFHLTAQVPLHVQYAAAKSSFLEPDSKNLFFIIESSAEYFLH